MGLTLATSTGFRRADHVVDHDAARLEHYFVAQITSDDVGRPSPYILLHAIEAARVDGVSQVIVVGDTPLDLQAGANGGMRGMVGVLSRAGTRKTMEPHTDLIDSVADLPALLRSKYGVFSRASTPIPASTSVFRCTANILR